MNSGSCSQISSSCNCPIALKQTQPIALLDSHLKWYNHITRELSRECIATEPVYGYYDLE